MPSRPERVDNAVEQPVVPPDRSKGRAGRRARADDAAVERDAHDGETRAGRDHRLGAVPAVLPGPATPFGTPAGPVRRRRGAMVRARADAAARGAVGRGARAQPEGRVVALVDLPHPAVWGLRVKRVVDVVIATLALLLVAPLLLVLAAAVRLESPGRVLFSQQRIGRGGRFFTCYKLRTMCADAEARLHADPRLRAAYVASDFKLPSSTDVRVTRIGRLLRVSSLDELPQLWNVVRGDMSLVGPRPIVAQELFQYGAADRAVLLSMRPGITGAWAVAGRSRVVYPQRAAIEVAYVRGWSLRHDAVILLKTVGAVLQRRGAT